MPGFCKPIAFKSPLATGTRRGVSLPRRGNGVTLLRTTPPMRERSTNGAYSSPEP
jgi:hypothetical protein